MDKDKEQAIEIEPRDLLDLLATYGAEVMARVHQGKIEELGELTASVHEELEKLLHKLGYLQPSTANKGKYNSPEATIKGVK